MSEHVMRRVLVANDSLDGVADALAKALRLAGASGAGSGAGDGTVRVLTTLYDRIAEEPLSVLPKPERTALVSALVDNGSQALNALVEPLDGRAAVETSVVWTGEPAIEIVEAASRWPADLLIKPVSVHHPVADYFHTPLDWALMRTAPCPVLVSKGDHWQAPLTVVAAVDAGDTAHAALCREILSRAAALARQLGAEIHVATAYPDLGQSVGALQVATDFDGIKADMRNNRGRTVTAMLDELNLQVSELHLLEGRAEVVIPDLARRLGATVTVLGSAARRGVAKLVVGNTAESLIGRLGGDLMTVREPWS